MAKKKKIEEQMTGLAMVAFLIIGGLGGFIVGQKTKPKPTLPNP